MNKETHCGIKYTLGEDSDVYFCIDDKNIKFYQKLKNGMSIKFMEFYCIHEDPWKWITSSFITCNLRRVNENWEDDSREEDSSENDSVQPAIIQILNAE